jgi:hypothetical protein
MNTKFDLKSALCGLLGGVLATLVIGAGEASNPAGRYQVSGTQTGGIILDTKTGQAWAFSPVTSAQIRNDADFFQPKVDK